MNKQLAAMIGYVSFVYALVLAVILFLATKMFEYSLWAIFGKEVPWYLDLVGGIVLNGANLVVFIICAFARAFGAEVPFYAG